MEHGVPEDRIIFINLIASPEGIKTFCTKFPMLRVITGWIDQGLNEKAYMCVLPRFVHSLQLTYSQVFLDWVTSGSDFSPVDRSRLHSWEILGFLSSLAVHAFRMYCRHKSSWPAK